MTDLVMTIFVRDATVIPELAAEYSLCGCSSSWNLATHRITVTRSTEADHG